MTRPLKEYQLTRPLKEYQLNDKVRISVPSDGKWCDGQIVERCEYLTNGNVSIRFTVQVGTARHKITDPWKILRGDEFMTRRSRRSATTVCGARPESCSTATAGDKQSNAITTLMRERDTAQSHVEQLRKQLRDRDNEIQAIRDKLRAL